jgi:hypothetical protein
MLSVTCKPYIMLNVIMLSVVMLRVIMLSVVMLSVIMLSVTMLSVIMLSVTCKPYMLSVILLSVTCKPYIMLNITMLSVVMLSVVYLAIHNLQRNRFFIPFVPGVRQRSSVKPYSGKPPTEGYNDVDETATSRRDCSRSFVSKSTPGANFVKLFWHLLYSYPQTLN